MSRVEIIIVPSTLDGTDSVQFLFLFASEMTYLIVVDWAGGSSSPTQTLALVRSLEHKCLLRLANASVCLNKPRLGASLQ